SRRRHTRFSRDWSSDVCSSDLKQATSRAKLLEKLTIEDIKPSSRKYPYIAFKPEREVGDQILHIEGLSQKGEDGTQLFTNLTFRVNPGDKIAFVGKNVLAISALFDILAGEAKPDAGNFNWGITITTSYFPKDPSAFF